MGYRTIIIKNRCKLELSLNDLVCRGEQDIKVNIDEISIIIIQNIACSITTALMSKLVEKKIAVIFCDPKSNPQFELMPYYTSFNSYSKISKQFQWDKQLKESLWELIIKEKIFNQRNNLTLLNKLDESQLLMEYANNVTPGDTSNREGHAAKVYFNAIFGHNFSRRDSTNIINTYLNYGYSIILSVFNREIVAFGYLTQFGIHHIGETNPFNLSCDFMEPIRPLIDRIVLESDINSDNYKKILIEVLQRKVVFDGKSVYLDNAIHLYVQNLLSFMNLNETMVIFPKYES